MIITFPYLHSLPAVFATPLLSLRRGLYGLSEQEEQEYEKRRRPEEKRTTGDVVARGSGGGAPTENFQCTYTASVYQILCTQK